MKRVLKTSNEKLNLQRKFIGIFIFAIISVSLLSLDLFEKDNTVNYNTLSPEWNQFVTVSPQDTLTQGITVNLGPGITETVAEIMEREAMLPADHYTKPKPRTNPEFEMETPEKRQNPNAPEISQWPPQTENQKNVKPNEQDLPQTVGTNFSGIALSESGFIPPDTQGDVGPSQVLVVANGRIKVFSKAGVLGGLNSDLDVFFTSVLNGSQTSDPHIRYDRLSGRWFVVAINLQTAPNRVMIARSSGSTITNTSSFTFFQFTANQPGSISGFLDYPTLGVDKNALYIGGNMFNNTLTSAIGNNGYVINKANLIAGSLTVTGFTLTPTGSSAGPYSPQGVDNDEPSATEGYFIGVDNLSFSLLVMKRVTNPGGSPSISGNLNITVLATVFPETVPQTGSASRMDALDDRLFAAEIHKNKITGAITLWTAHNIEVNSSGVASSSGNRDAARWYEITNLTTTPVLNQSGTLFDNAASNPRYYWIPSIAMSGQGHVSIGASTSALNANAGIHVAGRLRTDVLGTNQAATLVQSSSTIYTLSDGSRVRWGDYSQTSVDPNDDQTMWTFQEYCNAANSWTVKVTQLKAPAPATPSSSNITNIMTGQPSVNIIITGTSSGGTEFFDPGADAGGPGFANHIAASISGGVTVNSITFNSPTQVTLNISTVGSSAGQKNITITNPDGQQATGNNLINILPLPQLNFTSIIQGFYDASSNTMVRDTMRIYLRNNFAPYSVVDSGKVYLSNTGTGSITFPNASNGVNYYLQSKHRNGLQTWSAAPGQQFVSSALTYDFSSSAAMAFNSNQIQVDASPVKFAFFSGDVDGSEFIDVSDLIDINNDQVNLVSGYVRTDVNGDDFVDVSDMVIAYNNSVNLVGVEKP